MIDTRVGQGLPLGLVLTGGEVSDYRAVPDLLERLSLVIPKSSEIVVLAQKRGMRWTRAILPGVSKQRRGAD